MIGGRRHDPAGARIAEKALDAELPRERRAAARLHRQIGHCEHRFERGKARLENVKRCDLGSLLDVRKRQPEECARLLGARAHVGDARAQHRQVAQLRSIVLEAGAGKVRRRPLHAGARDAVRHRRRAEGEPRQDDLQHRVGALTVVRNEVALFDMELLDGHRRGVVAAQSHSVKTGRHLHPVRAGSHEVDRRFERRRGARLLHARDCG